VLGSAVCGGPSPAPLLLLSLTVKATRATPTTTTAAMAAFHPSDPPRLRFGLR
jgi:hypothetical protein